MESGCHVNIDQIMNKAPVAAELDCAPARLIEDELLKSISLEEQKKTENNHQSCVPTKSLVKLIWYRILLT